MSDVKLQKTIIIGFHRPNMRHVLVAVKSNLDWNLKLHVAPTWYIPLLQTNIHLQSCNFPFHYATRSSLVRSDGSGQFFFFFADRQDFCYVQDAEGSEPFTQVVCILFCNYKHNNNND